MTCGLIIFPRLCVSESEAGGPDVFTMNTSPVKGRSAEQWCSKSCFVCVRFILDFFYKHF